MSEFKDKLVVILMVLMLGISAPVAVNAKVLHAHAVYWIPTCQMGISGIGKSFEVRGWTHRVGNKFFYKKIQVRKNGHRWHWLKWHGKKVRKVRFGKRVKGLWNIL